MTTREHDPDFELMADFAKELAAGMSLSFVGEAYLSVSSRDELWKLAVKNEWAYLPLGVATLCHELRDDLRHDVLVDLLAMVAHTQFLWALSERAVWDGDGWVEHKQGQAEDRQAVQALEYVTQNPVLMEERPDLVLTVESFLDDLKARTTHPLDGAE